MFGGISVKFKDILMRILSHSFKKEKFESTKEVIAIRNSKKDIQWSKAKGQKYK